MVKMVMMGVGKLRLEVDENDARIEYTVWSDNTRRCRYVIDKLRPGWKKIWDETFIAITDTLIEIEGGPGLRSRTFQQNSLN